ncbi:short coiled-coil protein B-like [Saccostrea echinata]|uniref:short coiled-coil protein B-like n=1 Tax=Saccostrea echinata TaxID=191078 RepID=UPI002A7F2C5A|nr:short coiled-coil protein B-like [Saccostrea echinata]
MTDINRDSLYSVPLSSDSDNGELSNKNFLNQTGLSIEGFNSLDPDANPDELEEKQRLINQVMELQNTLDDLSSRVDSVKEENLKLKSENQVLGQYIENLMTASSVFQSTDAKSKKKSGKKKPGK